jgi:arylformamidase
VRLSARNEYLHLSPQAARDLTVAHHLPGALPPLRVFSGDGELDEFRRQGAEFARHLSVLGRDVRHQEIPSRNHFQVYDDFADPGSPVVRAASELAAQGASAAGKDHTATGR